MEEDQRGYLGMYSKFVGVREKDAEDRLRWRQTIHRGDQGTSRKEKFCGFPLIQNIIMCRQLHIQCTTAPVVQDNVIANAGNLRFLVFSCYFSSFSLFEKFLHSPKTCKSKDLAWESCVYPWGLSHIA